MGKKCNEIAARKVVLTASKLQECLKLLQKHPVKKQSVGGVDTVKSKHRTQKHKIISKANA